jgi:hypothetical protein
LVSRDSPRLRKPATSQTQTLWAIYHGTMKFSITIFLGLIVSSGIAQQLHINYRTTLDSAERLHYLIFIDNSNCKLIYPIRNHGEAMYSPNREFNLTYNISLDTITFQAKELNSNNKILERLLKSKFIVSRDRQIFDVISGYTYVDKELVSDKYDIYAIDGRCLVLK